MRRLKVERAFFISRSFLFDVQEETDKFGLKEWKREERDYFLI
jgi:hypothetical protein